MPIHTPQNLKYYTPPKQQPTHHHIPQKQKHMQSKKEHYGKRYVNESRENISKFCGVEDVAKSKFFGVEDVEESRRSYQDTTRNNESEDMDFVENKNGGDSKFCGDAQNRSKIEILRTPKDVAKYSETDEGITDKICEDDCENAINDISFNMLKIEISTRPNDEDVTTEAHEVEYNNIEDDEDNEEAEPEPAHVVEYNDSSAEDDETIKSIDYGNVTIPKRRLIPISRKKVSKKEE